MWSIYATARNAVGDTIHILGDIAKDKLVTLKEIIIAVSEDKHEVLPYEAL
jgi:hypothetical protein